MLVSLSFSSECLFFAFWKYSNSNSSRKWCPSYSYIRKVSFSAKAAAFKWDFFENTMFYMSPVVCSSQCRNIEMTADHDLPFFNGLVPQLLLSINLNFYIALCADRLKYRKYRSLHKTYNVTFYSYHRMFY